MGALGRAAPPGREGLSAEAGLLCEPLQPCPTQREKQLLPGTCSVSRVGEGPWSRGDRQEPVPVVRRRLLLFGERIRTSRRQTGLEGGGRAPRPSGDAVLSERGAGRRPRCAPGRVRSRGHLSKVSVLPAGSHGCKTPAQRSQDRESRQRHQQQGSVSRTVGPRLVRVSPLLSARKSRGARGSPWGPSHTCGKQFAVETRVVPERGWGSEEGRRGPSLSQNACNPECF